MEKDTTVWVGLDVSKKSTAVHRLVGGAADGDAWTVPTEERAVRRLARKLRRDAGPEAEIRCCYEAGPMGFTLQRWLESERGAGIVCEVVAPSLIPVRPGARVKTDPRDAHKLAESLRAGLLVEVSSPTPAQEAVRDLCRCREDAQQDLLRSRHRLKKFLLRRGYAWTRGTSWTQAHETWLRRLRFEEAADEIVYADYLQTVEAATERVRRLDQALVEAAQQAPYAEPVGWLRCYRGVDTVTAMTVAAELFGVERFRTARELMSYLGMTPSENSSGEQTRRGGITKAGNAHVRRVLIQAAWSQRHRPVVSAALRRRREDQPEWVVRHADRAMHRLHRKYAKMRARNKPQGKVVTAVAREMIGFLWAVLHNGARRAAA